MNILGISALDKDSCAALIIDGKIHSVVMEERLTRLKQQPGFPEKSIEEVFKMAGITAKDIDVVTYPFFEWQKEIALMSKGIIKNYLSTLLYSNSSIEIADRKIDQRALDFLNSRKDVKPLEKTAFKKLLYFLSSSNFLLDKISHQCLCLEHIITAAKTHYNYQQELEINLKKMGLLDKLERVEHQTAHSANAFWTSGFEQALIVTLDAYGSGLAGSISLGTEKGIKRCYSLEFPNSFGEFYSGVTAALGFRPTRHEGKIVGLAAYGQPKVLFDDVYKKFVQTEKGFKYVSGLNYYYPRYLAITSGHSKQDVAAAYQEVLERVTVDFIRKHVERYKVENIVMSGGVAANVKLNQRVFEIPGVKQIFIHPAMGDDGTSLGGALYALSKLQTLKPFKLKDVYFGPEYCDKEMEDALQKEGLGFQRLDNIEETVGKFIAQGKIIGRFNGRMEYGPRALGNRSILYHTSDPSVNDWLNRMLDRTEFMPFAPATLIEYKDKCYKNIQGAEYTSKFMTITCDCTDWMIKNCPAAVHIDGTARPQLVDKEINPSFYKIIDEYRKLTGLPSVINTSFNMHEEPIVCTPYDAIRAFKLGHLDYLAMGNYLVKGEYKNKI